MANCLLGWKNQIAAATLTASSAAAGLGPSNLLNDQGNAATAWQTTGTNGTLRIDTGLDSSTWRAFLLARTNLTASATVRWRVGPADALIEAPMALSANFAGGVPAGWTFARNSLATLALATGQLAPYAANSPRVEARGLLVEPAATNLFGWNDSATTGQSSGNAIAAGGGANYPGAATTQCTYSGPDTNVYFVGQGGLTSGQYYTASWWVWIPSGATLSSLTLAWEGNASNGSSVNADVTVRDRFQLVSCTAQINAANSSAVMRMNGAPAGTVLYVCSKQIELGRGATSYIHTTGGAAASRAADTLTSTAGVAAACVGGAYSLAALAYWNQAPVGNARLDVALTKGGVYTAMARFASAAQGIAFDGGGVQSAAFSSAYTASYCRIVVGVSPGQFGFSSFGGTSQSIAGLATAQNPDTLSIGANANTSVFLNGLGLYSSRLSAAQAQALATSGSTLAGALAYDSGAVPAGVVAGFGQSVLAAAAEVSGRVAVLDLNDAANPDGFLSVPLVYAGPALQPLRNYDYSSGHGYTDQTTAKTSRAGGVTKRNDWVKRVFDLSLSGIRAAEVPQIMALDRFGRQGGNVLLVPDPASAFRNQEALYGEFQPAGNLGYPFQTAEARSYRATITERL